MSLQVFAPKYNLNEGAGCVGNEIPADNMSRVDCGRTEGIREIDSHGVVGSVPDPGSST